MTPKLACGCVDSSQLAANDGRRGETCLGHTRPRFVPKDKDVYGFARPRTDWYVQNTCLFCGKVNSTGCACPESYTYTCDMCGIHSCDRLDMAHYKLRKDYGFVCPSTINKRTKAGKADLKLLADKPELNATSAEFPGKRSAQ